MTIIIELLGKGPHDSLRAEMDDLKEMPISNMMGRGKRCINRIDNTSLHIYRVYLFNLKIKN